MLIVKPIMNSAVEDIFGFKTCCGNRVFDQNLEIQVTNRSDRPVRVPSHFDLVGDWGTTRVRTLMPQGEQTIEAQGAIAFYCMMDEWQWARARELVFYDARGNRYPVDLRPPADCGDFSKHV